MKSIEKNGEFKRVSETEAMSKVKDGWNYVSKTIYKNRNKDNEEVDETPTVTVVEVKKPYSKKKK